MSDAERTGGDADGIDDQLPDLDEPGKYERFTRIDSVEYDVANEFLAVLIDRLFHGRI
ncbi:hypothetical protein [Halorubrum laminariae]|uniref:Uncharacterized protein n=1 Tax=Halorubrum laminariae TaxID=1433523 RepID=A0ABD6C5L3_9EURY|nr:hypothetical protein [Halorubrum laminariae]